MNDRVTQEQREDELRALKREIDDAEEHIYESVHFFHRTQEVAHEYASRHGVFDSKVKQTLEQNQAEFFEVKRDADRLVEQKQEQHDRLAAADSRD